MWGLQDFSGVALCVSDSEQAEALAIVLCIGDEATHPASVLSLAHVPATGTPAPDSACGASLRHSPLHGHTRRGLPDNFAKALNTIAGVCAHWLGIKYFKCNGVK